MDGQLICNSRKIIVAEERGRSFLEGGSALFRYSASSF